MSKAQINIFENMNFLVITSGKKFYNILEGHLKSFGAAHIERATNQINCMQKMSKQHYHIIICEYQLKNSLDGQEIFEELFRIGLLDYKQVFVLLTDKKKHDIAIRSIELPPDGYMDVSIISSITDFTDKILHLIKKKTQLDEIYQAMNARQYEDVLTLCEKKLKTLKGPILIDIFKLKGRVLTELGRYDDAIKHYEYLMSLKIKPWMLLELGKVYFITEKYMEAEMIFNKIISINEAYIDAYDWIAKIRVKSGDLKGAQRAYQNAIEIFPYSIILHQSLYDISMELHDEKTAFKALNESAELGRNSYFRRFDDFVHYADYFIQEAKHLDAKTYLGTLL